MKNIIEKVIEIIRINSDVKFIETSSQLKEDIGMDSLDMVTMLLDIEDGFNIELDESDMNPFELKTVTDVINLVRKYVRKK